MLSRHGCKDDVDLRQGAARVTKLKVDLAMKLSGSRIQRPQSDVSQQLPQPATILIRFRRLLNPDFQLAQNGIAGNEPVSGSALLANAISNCRDFADCSRHVVAI